MSVKNYFSNMQAESRPGSGEFARMSKKRIELPINWLSILKVSIQYQFQLILYLLAVAVALSIASPQNIQKSQRLAYLLVLLG